MRGDEGYWLLTLEQGRLHDAARLVLGSGPNV